MSPPPPPPIHTKLPLLRRGNFVSPTYNFPYVTLGNFDVPTQNFPHGMQIIEKELKCGLTLPHSQHGNETHSRTLSGSTWE